jgi:hypothetical protein
VPVVLMLAEHVHSTSQINIHPQIQLCLYAKGKGSCMKIKMVLRMNSVAIFATKKLHYIFTLVLNKLCIPDFDGILSTEKYAGYLRKYSISKHLKTKKS